MYQSLEHAAGVRHHEPNETAAGIKHLQPKSLESAAGAKHHQPKAFGNCSWKSFHPKTKLSGKKALLYKFIYLNIDVRLSRPLRCCGYVWFEGTTEHQQTRFANNFLAESIGLVLIGTLPIF